MINQIFENVQEHLSMLDLAIISSEKIKIYAANEDLQRLITETENRERLINVVAKLQRSIEEQINILNPEDVTQEDILLLKSWFQDLGICSEKMITIDKETVELLSQQKSQTTKEISLLFKNKEMFKGYNQGTNK